jgi:23S rRNA (cytosine1962-C5)-methyltransferase
VLIITIKQGKEKSLLARDPLIYVSAVERVDGKPGERRQPGATAIVQSSSGQFLARASHSPESQVRARVWSFDQAEAIDHAFIKRRVKAAIEKRMPKDKSGVVKSAARPVRLIDGDQDGLPGLEVDWFSAPPGYLVCRFHAAGVDAWKIPIVQALMTETGCRNVYEQSDPLMRKAETLPDLSGALAGDEPPPDLLLQRPPVKAPRAVSPAARARPAGSGKAAGRSGASAGGKTFILPKKPTAGR